MATIRDFEDALNEKNVQIQEIKQAFDHGVIKVTGYKVTKYTWDQDGKCRDMRGNRIFTLDVLFNEKHNDGNNSN